MFIYFALFTITNAEADFLREPVDFGIMRYDTNAS